MREKNYQPQGEAPEDETQPTGVPGGPGLTQLASADVQPAKLTLSKASSCVIIGA